MVVHCPDVMHVCGLQECGLEGNACCSGDNPCEVEGNVCAIFNDEGPSECTTCERAQNALNYGPNSPLRQECEGEGGSPSLPHLAHPLTLHAWNHIVLSLLLYQHYCRSVRV